MNQTVALLSWATFTLLLALATFIVRQKRNYSPLAFSDYVVLATSTAGLYVGIKILIQAFTDQILIERLEWDGAIALVIGGIFICYLTGREIAKLFQNTP
jgi:hypothetical protein